MATQSGQLKIAFFPIFFKIALAPAHFRITCRSARALSLPRPLPRPIYSALVSTSQVAGRRFDSRQVQKMICKKMLVPI